MTKMMVSEEIGTEPPQDPAVVAGKALADWCREALWNDGPYGSDSLRDGFFLLFEEDLSEEDRATPRETVIMQTPDGRVWHATITVTAVEQTERTFEDDEDDEDDDETVTAESAEDGVQ